MAPETRDANDTILRTAGRPGWYWQGWQARRVGRRPPTPRKRTVREDLPRRAPRRSQEPGQKFLELSYKQESIEIAKITSSIQLSAQQQKEIAEKLKVITGAKQIKLALKVDPQLIGGFTIEIGSKMIDTSIRGQLKQISSLLGA